jgi:SAM-dependent methyltransferase
MAIEREKYLAKSYGDQSCESKDHWGYAELDGKPVNLYGPEIIQRYYTDAILQHLDFNKKEVSIFDIGAGDGRVTSEISKGLIEYNPRFTLLDPSLSDPSSVVFKKYQSEFYNPNNNIVPKSLEEIQPWINFNLSSQDVVISMFVIQYLATAERVKLLLDSQYKLLRPGGIAINLWVGAKDQEESDWRTRLWLNIDKIRDSNIANKSITDLRRNWNQFSITEFDDVAKTLDFKPIIRTSELCELQKYYNTEMLTNGSRFKRLQVQSQINAIRANFQAIEGLYPKYFKDCSLSLAMTYSILQKPI